MAQREEREAAETQRVRSMSGPRMSAASVQVYLRRLRKQLDAAVVALGVDPANGLLSAPELRSVLQTLHFLRMPSPASRHSPVALAQEQLTEELLVRLGNVMRVETPTGEHTGVDVQALGHLLCAAVERWHTTSQADSTPPASTPPATPMEALAHELGQRLAVNCLVATQPAAKSSIEARSFTPQPSGARTTPTIPRGE
jgi:hypothetical protein